MENIKIEQSFKSPLVNFDAQNGIVELKGQLILENPKVFFEPLVNEWLEQYIASPQEKTTVNFDLEYFNTTSSMWIFKILKKLSVLRDSNHDVTINWYYNDDDMLELVEDYQALISLPINKIKTDFPLPPN